MSVRHNRELPQRHTSRSDQLIAAADRALRAFTGQTQAQRPNPAENSVSATLAPEQQRHAARLMRVNHSGEVAAQALYHGQSLTAKDRDTQAAMQQSATEEADHLAWCEQRINELDGRTSVLNPLWYAGSFAIGAIAGLAGDGWSLGFVAETERQVVSHLDNHLQQLPPADQRSRAILKQMRDEEAHHGEKASRAGGRELPPPVQHMMGMVSKVMTRTAYWI